MRQIAPNIYISTNYPEVNVGLVVGPAGVVAVDAPTLPRDALRWQQQIAERIDRPILYTVLTDTHPHRLLCAGLLGAPIVSSQAAYEQAAEYSKGFWQDVVRQLKCRYPEEKSALTDVDPVLPEILFSDTLTLHKGGTNVTVKRIQGGAPGSAWVDLRDKGVLFVGDTLVVGVPPVMDAGPDTKAWLNMLTTIRRPRFSDIKIVPGRGPISDQSATRPLSEYIRTARRRARSLHTAGRPKDDAAQFVDELISIFPVSDEDHRLRHRVKEGLSRVYEELEPDKGDGR